MQTLSEKISYWHNAWSVAESQRAVCAYRKDAAGADKWVVKRETARRCLDALYAEMAYPMQFARITVNS